MTTDDNMIPNNIVDSGSLAALVERVGARQVITVERAIIDAADERIDLVLAGIPAPVGAVEVGEWDCCCGCNDYSRPITMRRWTLHMGRDSIDVALMVEQHEDGALTDWTISALGPVDELSPERARRLAAILTEAADALDDARGRDG